MAMKPNRGFTLLVAVIFMSVVLALGLSLASLAYKQEILAASALQSQSAFYAADSGLECAQRADEQEDDFNYASYNPADPATQPSLPCGQYAYQTTTLCYNNPAKGCANELELTVAVPVAFSNPITDESHGTEQSCAVVTIYKPDPTAPGTNYTYLFSQGFSTSCENYQQTGQRFASRGLSASYQD